MKSPSKIFVASLIFANILNTFIIQIIILLKKIVRIIFFFANRVITYLYALIIFCIMSNFIAVSAQYKKTKSTGDPRTLGVVTEFIHLFILIRCE